MHPGQPKHRIDCPERNRSIGTKNYLDISDRFWKIVFAKSNLSLYLDIYLHVTTCHQLLEGVCVVNHQSRNIDSRFRLTRVGWAVLFSNRKNDIIYEQSHNVKIPPLYFWHRKKGKLQSVEIPSILSHHFHHICKMFITIFANT